MKTMYALWQPSVSALLGPRLRDDLTGVDATRLQTNLDDDQVASAQLRLSTFGEPVDAVVSVWADGDPADVTDVMQTVSATRVAGWVVDERVPLPPPPAADGERADALVNVALLRRPTDLDRDTWIDRWHHRHTQIAMETQATFGYVQNTVVESLVPDQPRVDALVEEYFPMAARNDLHAFYGSGGDDAELSRRMTRMLESVATFGADRDIDVVPTSCYAFALVRSES